MEEVSVVRLEQGQPFLEVTIEGRTARVYLEQKAIEYGYVYVGAEFEDVLPPVVLPADPENGRSVAQELYGFVDDPELVAAYRAFRAMADAGISANPRE